MSLIKKVCRPVVMLAVTAIACACTAPSDASKVQEQPAGGSAAVPEASVGTDAGTSAPSADTSAVGQAEAIPAMAATDTSAIADAPTAGDAKSESADDAEVDQQIGRLLGDAKPYRQVFDQLQQAVKADDRKAVAGLVDYPLTVKAKGTTKKTVRNADAFVADWDSIMTAEVRKAVLDQKYAGLFVNQNGAMLGSGQVWINGICQDNKCAKTDARISAINPDTP